MHIDPTVQVAAVTATPILLTILLSELRSRRHGKRLNELTETSDEIKYELKNSHETNLRDDLDEMREEIRRGFTSLFEDMRIERRDRLAGNDAIAARFEDHLRNHD